MANAQMIHTQWMYLIDLMDGVVGVDTSNGLQLQLLYLHPNNVFYEVFLLRMVSYSRMMMVAFAFEVCTYSSAS